MPNIKKKQKQQEKTSLEAIPRNLLFDRQIYLVLSRKSTVELTAINYFRIKASSQMFDWVLYTPLVKLRLYR